MDASAIRSANYFFVLDTRKDLLRLQTYIEGLDLDLQQISPRIFTSIQMLTHDVRSE
jgi:type II secretory pathway component HofQ